MRRNVVEAALDYLAVGMDPGRVEGNAVFTCLDAFDPDPEAVAALKTRYRRGGLGDAALKQGLTAILQATIAPIRDRRATLAKDSDFVIDILRAGTARARARTEQTRREVTTGLGLFDLHPPPPPR